MLKVIDRPENRRTLDKKRIAETWQQYYETRGYDLWGFSPSPAAKMLARTILAGSGPRRSERVEIIDWGCGYGRDSLYFIELGFDVIGIDVSEKAILLARDAYKRRQASGIPLIGSASFHTGDMRSVFASRAGQKARAFFSNRVVHLLSEADFCEAAREALSHVEEGAYFCVSGRSRDDFDAALMDWLPGKENEMACYRDPARRGHEIAFLTRERLTRTVGSHLKHMNYSDASEPERVGAADTRLLILIGRTRRRAANEIGARMALPGPGSRAALRRGAPTITRTRRRATSETAAALLFP